MATSEEDKISAKAPEVVRDYEKQATVTWDAEAEKKLRWKCDRNVLPCITVLFFLSFLDRTNIGEWWKRLEPQGAIETDGYNTNRQCEDPGHDRGPRYDRA